MGSDKVDLKLILRGIDRSHAQGVFDALNLAEYADTCEVEIKRAMATEVAVQGSDPVLMPDPEQVGWAGVDAGAVLKAYEYPRRGA